jgi:hypothetical protein
LATVFVKAVIHRVLRQNASVVYFVELQVSSKLKYRFGDRA